MKKAFWFWAAGTFFSEITWEGKHPIVHCFSSSLPSPSLPLFLECAVVYNVQSYLGGKRTKVIGNLRLEPAKI